MGTQLLGRGVCHKRKREECGCIFGTVAGTSPCVEVAVRIVVGLHPKDKRTSSSTDWTTCLHFYGKRGRLWAHFANPNRYWLGCPPRHLSNIDSPNNIPFCEMEWRFVEKPPAGVSGTSYPPAPCTPRYTVPRHRVRPGGTLCLGTVYRGVHYA